MIFTKSIIGRESVSQKKAGMTHSANDSIADSRKDLKMSPQRYFGLLVAQVFK